MTQRISRRTYDFRPPIWRSAKQLNEQTFVLLLALVGWLVLYGWLGWRLWSEGLERAGRIEVGLGIACVVIGIPLALAWWSALRRWRARLRRNEWPALTIEQVGRLTPSQFEEYVAQRLFARQGYQVNNVRDTKDGGVDIVVTDALGRRAIVQCKLYRNGVGEPIVRDLYGVLIHNEAYMAYLVTNSHISTAARRWAVGKPIALIDGAQLVELSKAEPQMQTQQSQVESNQR
jgi:restriction system protein